MAGTVSDWSTTAANNNAASPNGFPEGMAPSGVNDSARQIMAAIRSWLEDGGWLNWGDTHTYASSTSTTVSSDVTARYPTGRAIRAVGTTTGTIYGKVSSSSYSAPNTTINYTWDSGSLSNETLTISVGFVNVTGKPMDISGVRGAMTDPTTTEGDLVYFHTSGPTRLAIGTSGLPLTSNGTDPAYAALTAAGLASGAVTGAKIAMGSDASGDILYYNGTAYARLAKGTDGQVLSLASGLPSWATSPFTKSYDSGDQTITSAGSLTLAHSLGASPKICQALLHCATTEAGYSAGDYVFIAWNGPYAVANGNFGVIVVPDATNLNVRFGSQANVFYLLHKTTGVLTALTNANWKVVFRAYV